MDGAEGVNPATGGVNPNAAAPAGDVWRTQLPPGARNRIISKIMETLKKHLPVSVPEGLRELERIAVRFEERMYNAATTQSDYLRKISLKMLSMESQRKTDPPGPGSTSKGKKEKKLRCHFCKKGGHFKKDCRRMEKWFEKKGIAYDPTPKGT